MADQDMRLRLVVRRNGLPELRLVWNVQLGGNPTISKLLEQLNDVVPLESGTWGLEDYVVELHDSDGTDFECLHYHLVKSVLRPDDRVFIRALDRDDHRRRRVSGRAQISSDGRHLIDGVPFGRPLLRAPVGRPAVRIPPRKRSRLTYTQQDDDRSVHFLANANQSQIQLAHSNLQSSTTTKDVVIGSENYEDDEDDEDFVDNEANESSSSDDEQSLEDDDNDDEDVEEEEEVEPARKEDGANESATSDEETEEEEEEEEEDDDDNVPDDEDLQHEVHDLALDNSNLNGQETPSNRASNGETPDKSLALRAAFPMAPAGVCERVLAASNGDIKATYDALSEGYTPQVSREAVITWNPKESSRGTGLLYSQTSNNSTSAQNRESPSATRKRKLRADSPDDGEDSQDVEGEEHDAGLLRKYDHAGFPPGTITSGNGLAQMAKITSSFGNAKINGTSETTSTAPKPTVNGLAKKNTLEVDDDDDDTSSSGSSSSSTSSESSDEVDNVNKEDSSSEQTSSESTSSDSSDSDSESSDAKPKNSTSGSDTSDSDSDSDSGPEERPLRRSKRTNPAAKTNGQKKSTGSSDDTSDSGTSESDSSSESSSSESSDSESESESGSDSDSDSDSDSESEDDAGGAVHQQEIPNNAASQANTAPETITPNQSQNNGTQNSATPASVPPGSGKEATKRRNARRRAAKLRKQMMNDGSTTAASTQDLSTGNNTQNTQEGNQEAVIFEAKRKALLDALASGGVEVGPSGETIIDQDLQKTGSAKRKRAEDEEDGNSEQHDSTVAVDITDASLGDGEPLSPGSQKRRRLDVGATRRLVFGALGVRNPKTKEDEDKLRNQLQKGANQNRSSNAGPPSEAHEAVNADDEQDLESWKAKINYRAVECCSYGVELSAAPFPFQQRWDPQQQYSTKKGKRGGKGKQAQRNDAQYYSEESRLGQKGMHDNSNEFGSNGYDDMYAEEGDHMNTDVILNYDDGEARDTGPVNETSLATDLDDLPSLPKDISVLPILRPGEAQAGMVIAWQKWSCSSATSWQPQLSWVTAIVIKVDDDAAALELCLARRDRYLDGIEKRYDNRTGQRIYDRFEAPDLQEDEEGDMDAGVDDGYRSVFWADLQDPRILQQPLDPTNDDFEAEAQNVEPQPIHSVESEAEADTTIIHTQSVQSTGEQEFKSALASSQFEQKEAEGSVVEESSVRAASVSTFHQAGQGHHMADLIFSDLSQISSPSRQLLETASQAMDSSPPPASNNGDDGSPVLGALDSIPLPAPLSSIPRTEQFESDVIAGTPKAAQRQTMDPSSASSIRSAPQPVSESYEVPDSHPGLPPVISSSAPNFSRALATPGPNAEMDQENVREPVNISPSSSSSSLPSINSIWCSARTSQRDRSPSKAKTSFNSFESKLGGGMASSQPERSPSKAKTSFNSFDSKLGGGIASSQPERSPSKMKTSFNALDSKLGRDVVSSQLKQSPSKAKTTLLNSFESKLGGDVATPRAKRSPAKAKGLSNSFDSKLSRVTATDLSIDDSAKMSSSFPVKLEPSSSQPLTRTRRRSARPFSIPPNSQVVELSSDSEPAFAEHYADDDVDGTYTPVRESLPKGDGWVKKRPDPKRRKGRSL